MNEGPVKPRRAGFVTWNLQRWQPERRKRLKLALFAGHNHDEFFDLPRLQHDDARTVGVLEAIRSVYF
jgi:hypothetical protein